MQFFVSIALALVVIVVDAIVLHARPRWLARLAVLPLGLRRDVVLPQKLRSELAVSTSGGYRDGSTAIDLMRLAPALASRSWNIVDASVALQPEGWIMVLVKQRILWLLFLAVTGVSCRASVRDAMVSAEDALLTA